MIETMNAAAARRRALGGLLALAGVVAGPLAHADMLVEDSPLINGKESTVYTVVAPTAGTLNVSLSNLNWPDRLSSLSFALTTTTGVLKTLSQEGSLTFDLSSAGTYYAIVSGTAAGHWNLGMYSLRIGFTTLDAPVVPLPASAWMLLAGLGLLIPLVRKPGALFPSSLVPAY